LTSGPIFLICKDRQCGTICRNQNAGTPFGALPSSATLVLTADDKVDTAKGVNGLLDGGAELLNVTDVGGGGDAAATRSLLEGGSGLGEALGAEKLDVYPHLWHP